MEQAIQDELSNFGKRLRELRKQKNLTQIDLELLTGISNADISRIENGQKNVELVTIIRFAKALNCSVKDLFNYS